MPITLSNEAGLILKYTSANGLVIHQPQEVFLITLMFVLMTVWLEAMGVPIYTTPIKIAKWLRHAPGNTKTAIRKWYLPDEYLDKKENAYQYIKELQNRGDYDPTKVEPVHEYNKVFNSEGFPDREIIKVNNSYTGVYKDDYRGNDYIFVDRGRVIGRYVPMKRIHPDRNGGVSLEKATDVYKDYGGSGKLYTDQSRYYIDTEIAELLEEGDLVVLKHSTPVGYVEPRDKW